MNLLICNGPNLNLLGVREPSIYGKESFEVYFKELSEKYPQHQLHYFQSNHEGALIDELHRVGFSFDDGTLDNGSFDGIVLNAGAYTHTSIAIRDAIAAINTPVVEVHISNIHQRETFRHHSHIAAVCVGSIVGLGLRSYQLAIEYFIQNTK